MLPWLLAGATGLIAALAMLAWSAERARARRLAAEVQGGIEPYLRRKAAEAGMTASAPTWTSRATPTQIVLHSGRVARQLLEIEKLGPVPTNTRELEIAQTQPVADSDGLAIVSDKRRT